MCEHEAPALNEVYVALDGAQVVGVLVMSRDTSEMLLVNVAVLAACSSVAAATNPRYPANPASSASSKSRNTRTRAGTNRRVGITAHTDSCSASASASSISTNEPSRSC